MACHLNGQAVLALTPVSPFHPGHTALEQGLQGVSRNSERLAGLHLGLRWLGRTGQVMLFFRSFPCLPCRGGAVTELVVQLLRKTFLLPI